MTREEAIATIKENLCAMCAYGSQSMGLCDIRSCDNRDAIKALEQEPTTKNDLAAPQEPIIFRIFLLIVMFISGILLGMYI